METLPWSGIHIPGLEQPVDVNGDGVDDYYFTGGRGHGGSGGVPEHCHPRQPGRGWGFMPRRMPWQVMIWSTRPVRAIVIGIPTAASTSIRFPAKVIRDYKNAGYTISQNPYWDNE